MPNDLGRSAKQVVRAIRNTRIPPRARIPVLETDPAFDEGYNFWMDPNGNLRGYGPDGTKYQYSKTAVTAASGSFPADPMPEYLSKVYSVDWGRAFCDVHGVETTAQLGYGDDPSGVHGYRKIMLGLPDATIRTDTAGADVDRVELTLTNTDAFAHQVTLHLGEHNVDAAPTEYSSTWADVDTLVYPRSGRGDTWRDITVSIGEDLRDNLAKGLTIEQPLGNVNAGQLDWALVQLRISYYK